MTFTRKWIKPPTNDSITSNVANKILENKFVENIKPQAPLKPKIEEAQKKLQLQITKLEGISHKMQDKDQLIFKRIVYAMQNHDSQYAKVLSNELSQIRKMNKMVTSAKLAMEQIQIRLNTISELGDVVVTLSPCMSIIKGLGAGLGGLMPEANASMQDLSNILGDIMSGASVNGHENIAIETGSADTTTILEEAQSVLEGQIRSTIPDLPTDLPAPKRTEATI